MSEDGWGGETPHTIVKTRSRKGRRAVAMGSIVKRPISWLWKPFLQQRAINVLTGDPGVGKSTVVCELIAALTTGRPLPGEEPGRAPINCWFMNCEDAADDTTIWRLENQGADPSRAFVTDFREVLSSKVAAEIGAECRDRKIGFLVIDPLQAWMGKDVDMNRANETRDWAAALRDEAIKSDMAVLLCRHRRKGAPGDNKLYSGMGSIDITGIARSELSAHTAKDGTRVISRIKGTVGETGRGLAYTVNSTDNDHGRLRWEGDIQEDIGGKHGGATTVSKTPRGLGLAKDFLTSILACGATPAGDVLKAALSRGISERTLRRAKSELGVVAKQVAPNEWVWSNAS